MTFVSLHFSRTYQPNISEVSELWEFIDENKLTHTNFRKFDAFIGLLNYIPNPLHNPTHHFFAAEFLEINQSFHLVYKLDKSVEIRIT